MARGRRSRLDLALLFNSVGRNQIYELAAFSHRDKTTTPADARALAEEMYADEGNLGEYVSLVRQPVFVDDLRGWRATHGDRHFRVTLADHLESVNCKELYCVPLLDPDAIEKDQPLPVLTLNYSKHGARRLISDYGLLQLGRLTCQFLRRSREAKHERIQARLNDMAKRSLTASGRPDELRDDYLSELLKLIQDSLHGKGVSIFLAAKFTDMVQCLASTGLQRPDFTPIEEHEYPAIYYEADQSWTGECFATSKPFLIQTQSDNTGHDPRYYEARDRDRPEDHFPFLIYPIPTGPKLVQGERALGVIRCTGHRLPLFEDYPCRFTPAEIDSLDFICEQVSPILQTLIQRVEREAWVEVIQHDLAAPLTMVRDTTEKVADAVAEEELPKAVDLKDIEVSTELAIRLALQLGPESIGKMVPRPTSTLLEGDIVARLKDMLSHYAKYSNGMSIRFNGFQGLPSVRVDRDLVERAIHNLVINAVKYGDRGTTIEIDARPPDANAKYYVIDVTNRGMGIREEEQDKIFLPNYRSPAARGRASGVGWGLAIARRAIQVQGGLLEVTKLKDPTTLSIYIPK